MSDENIQRKILEFLYDIWQKEPFQPVDLTEAIHKGIIKTTEKMLYRNAEYLSSKGFIEKPQTAGGFVTEITSHGIDAVEDKRLSPDIEIRREILLVLKEAFDKDPNEYVSKQEMVNRSGLSEVEIVRNMKYLEDKGKATVEWATGGYFAATITALGIDSLREPTVFQKERNFMSNAYSILYTIENRLRIFIEKKLREKHGNQWWERGVPLKIRERSEEKKKEDPAVALSLICYTDFGDLRKIIMKTENWHDIFKGHFETLEHIVSRLDELEPIRHAIAHTRLLSNDDFKKLELFQREIQRMIE